MQVPISDAKLAAREYWIYLHASSFCSVFCHSQPNSGESCIVLESGPTCSLDVTCSTWFYIAIEKRCERVESTDESVCEILLPDVVVLEVHQNDEWSQLCTSAQLIYFQSTTQEFNTVGGYIEDLKKPQRCQIWRALTQRCLPGTVSRKWVWHEHLAWLP